MSKCQIVLSGGYEVWVEGVPAKVAAKLGKSGWVQFLEANTGGEVWVNCAAAQGILGAPPPRKPPPRPGLTGGPV